MRGNNRIFNLIKWSAISAALIGSISYCVFTVLAAQHFPGNFSASLHYLSVLGNTDKNPGGAMYYNLGVKMSGLSILLFYGGFTLVHFCKKRIKVLAGILIFGCVNGFSILMSGVYPEVPHYQKHFIWSLLIFITLVPVFIFVSLLLRQHSRLDKIIGYSGFALAGYNIIFVLYVIAEGTTSGSILEWIAVFSYISWILLNGIGFLTLKKNRKISDKILSNINFF